MTDNGGKHAACAHTEQTKLSGRGRIVAGVVAVIVVVIAVALVAVFIPKPDAKDKDATGNEVLAAVDLDAPVSAEAPDSKADSSQKPQVESGSSATESNGGDTEVDASELFGDGGSSGETQGGSDGGEKEPGADDPTEKDEEGEWTKYY